MKSSLKAYHRRMKDNFACGLELLVHFQIGLGFKVIRGFSLVASFNDFPWLLSMLCSFVIDVAF
jgi:hypothetical protein